MINSHPEIDKLLDNLAVGAANVLGDNFIGIYIYGSFAAQEFNYETSDIDFVGVSEGQLGKGELAALESMHLGLLDAHPDWAARLEGSYFTRLGLKKYEPAHLLQAHWPYGGRQLVQEEHRCDFDIHRWMLLDHGQALAGPEPAELIDEVSADQLKDSVRFLLASWWQPMLQDHRRLEEMHYRCYAVQTMCRVLYTLRFGEVVSKPAAARWTIGHVDESWLPLIRGSFAWPQSENEVSLEDTLGLIRFVTTAALAS